MIWLVPGVLGLYGDVRYSWVLHARLVRDVQDVVDQYGDEVDVQVGTTSHAYGRLSFEEYAATPYMSVHIVSIEL